MAPWLSVAALAALLLTASRAAGLSPLLCCAASVCLSKGFLKLDQPSKLGTTRLRCAAPARFEQVNRLHYSQRCAALSASAVLPLPAVTVCRQGSQAHQVGVLVAGELPPSWGEPAQQSPAGGRDVPVLRAPLADPHAYLLANRRELGLHARNIHAIASPVRHCNYRNARDLSALGHISVLSQAQTKRSEHCLT